MSIGPQLPPHLKRNLQSSAKDSASEQEKTAFENSGDFGPCLPPGFSKPTHDESKAGETTTTQRRSVIGPCLPSVDDRDSSEDDVIGPSMPNTLCLPSSVRDNTDSSNNVVIGMTMNSPQSYHDNDDDDDDDLIGPSLPMATHEPLQNSTEAAFEARAKAMKDKLTGNTSGGDEKLERETWMLELPPALSKNFGLGPRTFRANAPEMGDRSVWTDTPADRQRKRETTESRSEKRSKITAPVEKVLTREELEVAECVQQYNKRARPESLMDMHAEKRKKTPTNEPSIRRPFDRDHDLAVTRTDPKQRREFIEKAAKLNSKFAAGSHESKFL